MDWDFKKPSTTKDGHINIKKYPNLESKENIEIMIHNAFLYNKEREYKGVGTPEGNKVLEEILELHKFYCKHLNNEIESFKKEINKLEYELKYQKEKINYMQVDSDTLEWVVTHIKGLIDKENKKSEE